MDFASIRIITDDLDRLVGFYESVTQVPAERPAPVFAEFVLPSATLAIGDSNTVQVFGADSARAADNHTVIIEFQVDDVEDVIERYRKRGVAPMWGPETLATPFGRRRIVFFRSPSGFVFETFENLD